MDKTVAKKSALRLLHELIKNQPGMIQFSGSQGPMNMGADAAKFCTDFVDAYAEWLINQGDLN